MEQESSRESAAKPKSLMALAEFRYLVYTRLFMIIGIQINSVAVGWFIYDLTKDPLYLGFIGLMEAIPAISISLFAGHIADTMRRRTMALRATVALLVCFTLVLSSVIKQFHWDTDIQIIIIYAAILGNGLARGFLTPALFSLLGEIVPKERLPESSTILSGTWQAASIVGPAICGFIYGFIGPEFTFSLSVCLISIALFNLWRLKPRPAPVRAVQLEMWQSIKEGISFVFNQNILLAAISLDLFAVLLGGAVALLPAVSDQILHLGPEGLGILRASPAVGAVIIAAVILRYPIKWHAGYTLFGCVAGFGICMVIFGLSTNIYLSCFILALSGVFDNVSVVIRRTILQVYTPNDMRGRVSAVESIFISSSNEIGEFESGITASAFGLRRSIVLGGVLSVAVVGVTAWLSPKLRNYQKLGSSN